MHRILMMRLEGPLMTLGTVAIDDRVPVSSFPSTSMIVGILANALGFCRTRPAEIQALQDGVMIASRLDRPGRLLNDYQTVQVGKGDKIWSSSGVVATRGGGADTYDNPAIINREYWADAAVTVAVQLPLQMDVDVVAEALQSPQRPLFLGRVSCPPARPILHSVVTAGSVLEALSVTPADDGRVAVMQAQWPSDGGGTSIRQVQVTDVKDWAFGVHMNSRTVSEGMISVGAVA